MTISRKDRIKTRAELYANGEIDLQDFYNLEKDEEDAPEKKPKKRDPLHIVSIVSDTVYQDPGTTKKDPRPVKRTSKKPTMTKEEYDKLSLHEQQKLYDEDPDSVKIILGVK